MSTRKLVQPCLERVASTLPLSLLPHSNKRLPQEPSHPDGAQLRSTGESALGGVAADSGGQRLRQEASPPSVPQEGDSEHSERLRRKS